MNFMQQMDEIYFIIGVKKYTNGIDFHRFHGGKFLPCQIVSDILKGQVGQNGWDEVMWLQRTLENIGECSG